MSGKGSAPRPYGVDKETFASNWERTFGKKKQEDNTGTSKNEYQDILATEDCLNKPVDANVVQGYN